MRISKFLPMVCAIGLCAGFSVRAQDNPAQAAARAALMEKLNEMGGQPDPSQNQTPAPAATSEMSPAPAQTNAATEPTAIIVTTNGTTVETTAPMTSVAPTGSDNAAQAAARAALEAKMGYSANSPAAPVAPAAANQSGMGFQPIEMVPPPFPPAKEAQLRALLQQYEANQVTPEQYQAQRAKILAEPEPTNN